MVIGFSFFVIGWNGWNRNRFSWLGYSDDGAFALSRSAVLSYAEDGSEVVWDLVSELHLGCRLVFFFLRPSELAYLVSV